MGHVKGEPLIHITGGTDVTIAGININGAFNASGIRAIDSSSSQYRSLTMHCVSIKSCRSIDMAYAPAIHAVGFTVAFNFGWIQNNTGAKVAAVYFDGMNSPGSMCVLNGTYVTGNVTTATTDNQYAAVIFVARTDWCAIGTCQISGNRISVVPGSDDPFRLQRYIAPVLYFNDVSETDIFFSTVSAYRGRIAFFEPIVDVGRVAMMDWSSVCGPDAFRIEGCIMHHNAAVDRQRSAGRFECVFYGYLPTVLFSYIDAPPGEWNVGSYWEGIGNVYNPCTPVSVGCTSNDELYNGPGFLNHDAGNFRLSGGTAKVPLSVCIDRGPDNDGFGRQDIDFFLAPVPGPNASPADPRFDIGAHEWTQSASWCGTIPLNSAQGNGSTVFLYLVPFVFLAFAKKYTRAFANRLDRRT